MLSATARALPSRFEGKDPVVLLMEFADSSIVFEASIWIRDPWAMRATRSDLNHAIWRALKEHGITIAFPQLDLHVKGVPSSGGTASS